MGQKRNLPAKVAAMQARKKQKLDGTAQPQKKNERKIFHKSKAQLKLDELDWRNVELPEGLDDYEGFYGLQEIEGVDVLREEGEGTTLKFAVADGENEQSKKASAPRSWDNAEDPFPAHVQVEDNENDDEGEEEEEASEDEWVGFGDEDIQSVYANREETPINGRDHVGEARGREGHRRDLTSRDHQDTAHKETSSGAKEKSLTNKASDSNGLDAGLENGVFAALLDSADESTDGLDLSAWNTLNLSPAVIHSLEKLGFTKPTPIQSRTIPSALSGEDIVGKAPTGSGKTLAFGIPILEHWLSEVKPHLKTRKPDEKAHTALILLPTRELAVQIDQHLRALYQSSHEEPPQIATLTGGLSIHKQKRLLDRADIVIATPGRLWEIISESQGVLAPLQRISFLVVDEADRLLSDGHFKELTQIIEALDRKVYAEDEATPSSRKPEAAANRQTLVFSATFAKDLQQKLSKQARSRGSDGSKDNMEYLLAKLNFRSPKPAFIDVQPDSQMATGLREGLLECPNGMDKDLYLYTLSLYYPSVRALVFVNSISAVRRLVPFLTNLNVTALPLHSQMAQKARLRSIERFSGKDKAWTNSRPKPNGSGTVLVATDVAARGLDIPAVGLVIHYHVPRAADTYVHRSGRTARADLTGSSVLICAPEEAGGVRRLVARVHAAAAAKKGAKSKRHYALQSLELDRRLAARLKPRVSLAKTIADAEMAKEKKRGEDSALREAADDLGIEYDSDDDEMAEAGLALKKNGRGQQRKEREREGRDMTKAEMKAAKAELRALMSQRINTGVSERYITGTGMDIDRLLRERANGGGLLGSLPPLGFES